MANNKKYFWIKLKENFFKQREIKKLRKIAGGDTYTIIYLKMQLLAMKNEGWIEFEETERDIFEQLEIELDEERDNIEVVSKFLISNNLMEINERQDCFLIETIECIGKETASTRRSRKHREIKNNTKVLHCNTKTLQYNTDATKCNIEIDKDIEIDKEIDKDKDKDKDLCKQSSSSSQNCFKFYNKNIGPIPPFVAEEIGHFIDDGVEDELIKKALQIAVEKNIRNWSYAKTIIKNKVEQNILTLKDFEASELNRKSTKKEESIYSVDFSDIFEDD